MSVIKNEMADQPASQSAKCEKTIQNNYSTKISPVKEDDYYIQVPISVHNEGIRALATLANITSVVASEESSLIDTNTLRVILGLDKLNKKGDRK